MSAINGLFSLFVCLPQTVVLLYKKCLDKICQGIYILTITDEKRRAERGCFLSAAFTPWRGRARARTSLKQTRKEKKAEYSAQTRARRAERTKKRTPPRMEQNISFCTEREKKRRTAPGSSFFSSRAN